MRGKAFCYGDNVNTDVIIPARYLNTTDSGALAMHCMEDIDASFASAVREGDVVVGGENFGCGSSREHAPLALFSSGVRLVVAKSFARIFFRNAINTGLAIMECAPLASDAQTGDIIEYDTASGVLRNVTRAKEYTVTPLPPFVEEIIGAGGLMGYARKMPHTTAQEGYDGT